MIDTHPRFATYYENKPFRLVSNYKPEADQIKAIDDLSQGILEGKRHQVLLGVTGSGKTFTMANVIQKVQKPTLVLAPNKTLAAQLFREFKNYFPHNCVEYFVSYYDYYQPEAYVPSKDLYIEKDSSINDDIDRMRHAATRALFEERDVIIVASVSCIYGLGSPEAYYGMIVYLQEGMEIDRDRMLRKLIEIQYSRNDIDFSRGTFRVKGDVVEILPAYEENAIRIEFFDEEVERLTLFDPLTGHTHQRLNRITILPNSHYVVPQETLGEAIEIIRSELKEREQQFLDNNKYVEAQRILERTNLDIEMMIQVGYCNGIENYSRHLSGRTEGEPPATLLDFFPKDHLCIIDESHITVPQLHGMYRGDRSRKMNLVEFGFRLPSALDNRPLKFEEFMVRVNQIVYVSATPGPHELEKTDGEVVEQVIRPTGLIDPIIEVRPVENQVDDLLDEIQQRTERGERVLVTTLTKRMAEDLTEYYSELGIKTRYLHSEVDTIERVRILKALRQGEFDVLIGINLLREGLDLPEVSLVAILDADKEGFLRSTRSLIQTIGRSARNLNGKAIFYAEKVTRSMAETIDETNRRRAIQERYNIEHNITPASISKAIDDILESVPERDYVSVPKEQAFPEKFGDESDVEKFIRKMEKKMKDLAKNLEFEKAAELRDQIKFLKETMLL